MRILRERLHTAADAAQSSMKKNRVPGCAMVFLSREEDLLRACFGLADSVEGIPVTEETYFEAASLTKPVFAHLVHRLAEEGILDLYAPLSRCGVPAPGDDPRLAAAAAKHVLSHGTGLPNWGACPLPLSFAPGQGFAYSGSGYQYLQQCVEQLCGTRLDDLLQRYVFDPMGMESAAMVWTGAMRRRLARTWDAAGEPERCRSTARHASGMEPNAAYSLYVTLGDYPKFLRACLKDAALPGRIAAVKNPAAPGVCWGLGWGMTAGMFWHWGDNGGFKSFTGFDPAAGDAFVIHTNGENGLSLCFDVLRAVTDADTAPIENMIRTVD